MTECWKLIAAEGAAGQDDGQLSFIGGLPRLPARIGVPDCRLCGQPQSFLMQVAFPEGHAWSGLSLAIFACTTCVDEDHLIPEMLTGPLPGADIPGDFLESYQKNFRFLVFETGAGAVRRDYAERVRHIPLTLTSADNPAAPGNKVGGAPNWMLEDESPATRDGRDEMIFLMQIEEEFAFPLVEGAPPQIEMDYLAGTTAPSPERCYRLFIGNAIYLFGVRDRDGPLVYAITQI